MSVWRVMTFTHRAAVAPLIVLAMTGCGVSAASGGPAPAGVAASKPITLGVANRGNLDNILVDAQGRTLYLFEADAGMTSTCSGACATAWPPLTTTGAPTVGGGVNPALVGTTKRSDQTTQVTYNGHPLYRFAKDSNPGDTHGQGLVKFGAAWFVVSTSGSEVAGRSSSSSGSTSSGGGGSGY